MGSSETILCNLAFYWIGCQPQTFVTMEEMNRNLQKLEDDHQLMIGEQEGSLMDGRYHRYQSLNFDKPEWAASSTLLLL